MCIELSVDEIPASYLSNENIDSTDDEMIEEGVPWNHAVTTTPTARAKYIH